MRSRARLLSTGHISFVASTERAAPTCLRRLLAFSSYGRFDDVVDVNAGAGGPLRSLAVLLLGRTVQTMQRLFALAVVLSLALAGCSALPLNDGQYTCGPVAGTDMDHMVASEDSSGSPIDIFATVADGDVKTLDFGPYGEISSSIDGMQKKSNSRFNVRIVNDEGGNGKYFTTGDQAEDLASYGNWLLCVHDG